MDLVASASTLLVGSHQGECILGELPPQASGEVVKGLLYPLHPGVLFVLGGCDGLVHLGGELVSLGTSLEVV